MARKGREAELVLKKLENYTLDGQAEVKSPDWIYDVVAKKPREVDVSIRIKIGANEFLTIIECRDRKKTEGIDWIEQIATKTSDINADYVIAVSTKGFTTGAIMKARHYNIILRTLKEFNPDEITEWIEHNIVTIDSKRWTIIDVRIDFKAKSNEEIGKEFEFQLNTNEKKFKNNLGELFSLNDIISIIGNTNHEYLFENAKEGNLPIIKKINIIPDSKFPIELDNVNYRVKSMYFTLECWIEPEFTLSPTKTLRYRENSGSIIDTAEYEYEKMFLSLAKIHKRNCMIVEKSFKSE